MKKKKVCWGAFEGSCNSWYSGICVMSRPSHVSERSLQRSEFERAAHGFSRFPNALELQGSETKPQHTFFFFTYLLNDSKLTTLQYWKKYTDLLTWLVVGYGLRRKKMGCLAYRTKGKDTGNPPPLRPPFRYCLNAFLHPNNGPLVHRKFLRHEIYDRVRTTSRTMQTIHGRTKTLSALPAKFQLWHHGLASVLLGGI